MRPVHFYSIVVSCILLSSCVSTSKYKAMQSEAAKYDTLYNWSMQTLKKCQDENKNLNDQKTVMKQKMNEMDEIVTVTKETDAQLKQQLSALSAISSAQAESLRKSMDNIGAKDNYIQDLRLAVTQRDSKNMAVLMELKSILGEAAASVKIVDGAVYATVADSLLFSCDTIACTLKSKKIVSRIARVLSDQPSMTCTVEGNGDSLSDNWDLPVNRATLVVRMLQRDFNITPSRLNATGRNQYVAPARNYDLDSAISALKTNQNSPVHVDAAPATLTAAKSDSAAQSTAAQSTGKTDTSLAAANQPKADSSLATAPKTDTAAVSAANPSDSAKTDSAVAVAAVKSDTAAGQSIAKTDTALAAASQPKADTALAVSTDSTAGTSSGILQPDTTVGASVTPAVVHPATFTRFIFYPPTEKLQRLLEGKREQSSQPAPSETGAAANVPASASVTNQQATNQ